ADDSGDLPQLFLKETVLALGSYMVEQPTTPVLARSGPILKDLDTAHLPPLRGYNSTTPRATADLLLTAPNGDPLLSGWQYGLGRAVAWMPDMKGRWATDWITWAGFPQFAAQLVGWTLPRASPSGLESSVTAGAGHAQIVVDSHDPTGLPRDGLVTSVRVTGPDGSISEVELPQTATGRYEGAWLADAPGAYSVDVRQSSVDGTTVVTGTTGMVVPYPAEYRLDLPPDTGPAFLRDLAAATGGRSLDPAALPDDAPAGAPRPSRVPAWPLLLTLALLLFPLDVAIRRVTMGRREVLRLLRLRR
ncbi:MAG TPA: glutamine amidotransferase, partial [Chloroflexia bacterium]|nr:glutamine amidotransferase [Chloroflexia bacterium]